MDYILESDLLFYDNQINLLKYNLELLDTDPILNESEAENDEKKKNIFIRIFITIKEKIITLFDKIKKLFNDAITKIKTSGKKINQMTNDGIKEDPNKRISYTHSQISKLNNLLQVAHSNYSNISLTSKAIITKPDKLDDIKSSYTIYTNKNTPDISLDINDYLEHIELRCTKISYDSLCKDIGHTNNFIDEVNELLDKLMKIKNDLLKSIKQKESVLKSATNMKLDSMQDTLKKTIEMLQLCIQGVQYTHHPLIDTVLKILSIDCANEGNALKEFK